MDHSTSTVQSVAQAVQAATAQQQLQQQQAAQQQASHPSPPVQPSIQSSVVDNLTCQWQGCGERTDTAESLYDHVCERHVGRKSTNNLNLTCQWGACRTTTVKRDHITSHIRVHVPLKPHKCDFCGKAFKRPQDLKKHVKTHADDSVLMSSPSHGNNGARGSMGAGALGQQNGKTQGYYPASHDTSMTNPYPNYQPAMGAAQNGNSYAQPAANGYSGYGSVSYPNNSAIQDLQSMDTRRRAIEALNDFLGDIKRRAIDPSSYYDVGQRLQSNSLPLPVGSGYNTGYNNNASGFSNYNATNLLDAFTNSGNMGGGGSGLQAGVATQTYGLPLPNARTKNDLQDIDRFLEQLQATVYETSGQQSVAGVQQPGIHAMHTGEYGFSNHHGQFRSSDSPPDFHGNSSMSGLGALSSMSSMPGATTSTALDTPALTPASVSSYTSSGHSPVSSNGRSSFGNISGRQMYPNLPSVTGISDIGAGYPTTTSAPASGLASAFEGLEERRYSGGRLQRQAPAQDTEMKDADEGARTPKASEGKSKRKGHSTIDPALRDEDSASTPAGSSSEGAEDRRQEEWVENIRVIETIKKWVAERLKNGEYEEAESERKDAVDSSKSSIEIAKMVEEKMADADNSEDVKYPTLPST